MFLTLADREQLATQGVSRRQVHKGVVSAEKGEFVLYVQEKSISVSWYPSKEKAENLIKDFLLGGAAGGQLAFGCKIRANVARRGIWIKKT